MYTSLKYFSVHDKILYHDACRRMAIDLKENWRVLDTRKG
jgi:hypothetical protein